MPLWLRPEVQAMLRRELIGLENWGRPGPDEAKRYLTRPQYSGSDWGEVGVDQGGNRRADPQA